jgi:hypothetical protein
LNYVGKFESSGLESPSNAHIELDSLSHRGGPANSFTVPDAHLLFSGDYHRSGPDLIISDHDHRVVVPGPHWSRRRGRRSIPRWSMR